jgi:DNA-directed RNA polymerase specialized sigma24 family protein
MLRAVEHIEQLRDRERVTAWFYAILRRAVADAHAAKVETSDVEVERLGAPEPVLQCNCSLRELDALAPQYADILRRMDVQGQSPARVAGQLGLSGNNVTVRLHRARQALRARLKERCGTTSVAMCQTCTC